MCRHGFGLVGVERVRKSGGRGINWILVKPFMRKGFVHKVLMVWEERIYLQCLPIIDGV